MLLFNVIKRFYRVNLQLLCKKLIHKGIADPDKIA